MNEKLKKFLKKFIKVGAYDTGKGYNALRYSFGSLKYERKLIPKLKKLNEENKDMFMEVRTLS